MLRRLDQQISQVIRGYRVGDSGRLTQRRFLASLDEHHIDDADDFAAAGIEYRASAVAWVGRGIELENVE